MYKFLIVLAYYERPKIVLNALRSLNEIEYDNFEVRIIDDGERDSIYPIALEILNDKVWNKTSIIKTFHTLEYKLANGGSKHGSYINDAMRSIDSDYIIVLCDDDAIVPDALTNLNKWFEDHPEKKYTYGHIIPYNPEVETIGPQLQRPLPAGINRTEDINPTCMVDSSQVVFSSEAVKKYGVGFPEAQTSTLDAALFTHLFHLYGPCSYCGFFVQYKGIFPNQLGNRLDMFNTGDVK